ncbi:MAG: glycosyltransferase family 2 protein [Acidobacteria bacterium]|nr:glycosyltransferase family 2 protein [Acidobacteriota bacterium]MBI3657607.1 glycosyltransferase family 2 protein [Acidobacteriota bacterium]
MQYPTAPAASPLKVSFIIPVHNGGAEFVQCLQAIAATTYTNYECIVVDDGSTDNTAATAAASGANAIFLKIRRGPAYARNRGVEKATGDLLFFVDADVCVYPDTVDLVVQTFQDHPEIDALIGSYDDCPGAPNFMSQYKNLFHHFVHQTSSIWASTFWGGCGAIRKAVFLELGGFDEAYGRSCIEDIELGYRLKAAQHAIMLNKAIQVKHMKRWTLRQIVRSDIFDRGLPWTLLLLQDRSLPNDLNLKISQRISVVLSYLLLTLVGMIALYFQGLTLLPLTILLAITLMSYWYYDTVRWKRIAFLGGAILLPLICIALVASFQHMFLILPFVISLVVLTVSYQFTAFRIGRRPAFLLMVGLCGLTPLLVTLWRFPRLWLFPIITLVALVIINFPFYRFFAEKKSWLFAVRVLPFHLLYFIYSGIAFVWGIVTYFRDKDKASAAGIAER